jgi:heptosyltransferase-1
MKILIVKISSMAEIVDALPVLEYLHHFAPGCEIDWLVEDPFQELLEGNPLLSRIYPVKTWDWRGKPLAKSTRNEIRALREELRQRHYDRVYDLQGNLKSGLLCWLAHVREVVGFAREELMATTNLWFTTRQIPLRPKDRHMSEKYLRVVSVPFGRDYGEQHFAAQIHTDPESELLAEALLSTLADGLVFLCHCGSTWQTKLWSTEAWIDLGKRILESYADSTLLFSWGQVYEKEEVLAIAAGIGVGARVLDRYDLKGLTAIIKKVDMVIGSDTGPVHIAATVGTPTVSFYMASDARRSGPKGEAHLVIQSPLHCARCFLTECERDAECRASITVDAVFNGVEKLLLR